jgi:hypothetical protein
MPAMHYGALIGRHRCVEHLFQEARARLHSLEIMQPAPKTPAPPPPRRQPPRSPDAVVNDFFSLADEVKRPGDTFLGVERKEDEASGGSK